MAEKIPTIHPDEEEKLYSEFQHISSVKIPLILCGFALLGCLAGIILVSSWIFFLIALLPIAYMFYLWFRRDFYSITNHRFIRGLGKKNIAEVPIGEIVAVNYVNGENKQAKHASLDVVTTVKYGEKILIREKEEFGAYRCQYVPQPQNFIETIELAKNRERGLT